jgi:hypothetical protein
MGGGKSMPSIVIDAARSGGRGQAVRLWVERPLAQRSEARATPTLHATAVTALVVAPPLTENDREFEFGNNPLTLSRDDGDANF